MAKYLVTITATVTKDVEVEADSFEGANELAHELFTTAPDDNCEDYEQETVCTKRLLSVGDRVRISARDSSATVEWGRIVSEGTVLEDEDPQVAEVLVECDALSANVLILPSEMALIGVAK